MTPISLLLRNFRGTSLHLSWKTQISTAKGHSSFSVCLCSSIIIIIIVGVVTDLTNPSSPPPLFSLAFDENETYEEQNRISALLLGNAIPKHLIGTTDDTFYTHYSEIATIEANWDLPTLGRHDVGANVFAFVAKHTHDEIRTLKNPPLAQTFLNASYPGVFNSLTPAPLPIPNTTLVVNGRRVLESIVDTWGSPELQKCTVYTGALEIASAVNPPVLPAGCRA